MRIDEAAGIAELFETSVDVMLGRSAPNAADNLANEVRLARHAATQAQLTCQEAQISLASTVTALQAVSGFQPEGEALVMIEGCRQAERVLAQADEVLAAALAEAGGLAR